MELFDDVLTKRTFEIRYITVRNPAYYIVFKRLLFIRIGLCIHGGFDPNKSIHSGVRDKYRNDTE